MVARDRSQLGTLQEDRSWHAGDEEEEQAEVCMLAKDVGVCERTGKLMSSRGRPAQAAAPPAPALQG